MCFKNAAALRYLIDNAKRDPVNGAILPMIGAAILFVVWHYGILPWAAIKEILFHD